MQRDYRVDCLDCGATYTPKSDGRPSECHECGSIVIDVTEIEP